MPNPLNIADGFSICLENAFGDYVFAHYSDFVLDPDILAYIHTITIMFDYLSVSQPSLVLKGDIC